MIGSMKRMAVTSFLGRGYRLAMSVATAVAILFVSGGGRTEDYGQFIQVETEEDLLDLLTAQELTDEQYEQLRELLEDGVDLNTASRDELYALPNLTYSDVDAILEYRKEAGYITHPADLVAAGVIDLNKMQALEPFLLVVERKPGLWTLRGRARYQTSYVAGDPDVPGMAISARLATFRHLEAGIVGVLTRQRLGDVRYDPNRDALSAEPPGPRFNLPKFFLHWNTKDWQLLAGTYRIGFGQRLTFDNTTLVLPNGARPDDTIYVSQDMARSCRQSEAEQGESPCAGEERYQYQSPDFHWTDRLRGAVVGLKHADMGSGWLQAYGFFSYQTRSIYQYEIYDRRYCDDPANDDDPGCGAPWVYYRKDDLLEPTSRFSYQTLPDMFNELLGGGNVSYFFDRRTHVGVTGYGADISWLVQGMQLDFQEWSRLPYGGPFGAVGVDAAWGSGDIDLFAEVAQSFDSQPSGGGTAAIVRTTWTHGKHEFEGVVRYYDTDFANPYARPVSAPDEYDGLRARDESGVRLRYRGKTGDLRVHGLVDFWGVLSDQQARMRLWARADYDLATWLVPGLWFEAQDRDLSDTGRHNCFEVPTETIEGEPVPCAGEKYQLGVQFKFLPLRRMSLTLKYQHRFLDDGSSSYDTKMRQDSSLWVVMNWWLLDSLRLRARLRYLNEAIDRNDYLEQSLWGYAEALWKLERTLRVKLRYEIYAWLDSRTSTQQRNPNPAHWLRLELEWRF